MQGGNTGQTEDPFLCGISIFSLCLFVVLSFSSHTKRYISTGDWREIAATYECENEWCKKKSFKAIFTHKAVLVQSTKVILDASLTGYRLKGITAYKQHTFSKVRDITFFIWRWLSSSCQPVKSLLPELDVVPPFVDDSQQTFIFHRTLTASSGGKYSPTCLGFYFCPRLSCFLLTGFFLIPFFNTSLPLRSTKVHSLWNWTEPSSSLTTALWNAD